MKKESTQSEKPASNHPPIVLGKVGNVPVIRRERIHSLLKITAVRIKGLPRFCE